MQESKFPIEFQLRSNIIIEMIFIDLETTGLDSKKDEILEFAAIRVDSDFNVIWSLDFLCKPTKPIPATVLNLTWINQVEISDWENFSDRVKEIEDFLWDDVIVGHNIKFDLSFLSRNWLTKEYKFLDTHVLAWIFLPWFESYSLEVLSSTYWVDHSPKHRARWDIMACINIYKIILGEMATAWDKFDKLLQECWVEWKYTQLYQSRSKDQFPPLSSPLWDDNFELLSELSEECPKYFEFSSQPEIINYASNFLSGLWNRTIVCWKYIFSFLSKKAKDINVVLSPSRQTSINQIINYIKENWINDVSEWVILKVLFACAKWLSLNNQAIHIAYEEYLIWDKLCLKEAPNSIKDKNIIDLNTFISMKDQFTSHDILFMDIDLEEQDITGIISENTLLEKCDDKAIRKKMTKIFKLIKEHIYENVESTHFWYTVLNSDPFLIKLSPFFQELKALLSHFPDLGNQSWYYSYINLNNKDNLTFYHLKVDLIDDIRLFVPKACFWFFAWASIKYYEVVLEIKLSNLVRNNNKSINIQTTDINAPSSSDRIAFEDMSKWKLVDLIRLNACNTAILVNSKKQTEDINWFLNEYFSDYIIVSEWLSWWLYKAIYKIHSSTKKIICIWGINFYKSLMLRNPKNFDLWIVMRLPFDPPWWIYETRSLKFYNSFIPALARAIMKVKAFAYWTNIKTLFYMDNKTISTTWWDEFNTL